MATSSLSNVAFVAKNLFSGDEPETLASRARVWLTKLKKKGGWTGTTLAVGMKYGNPQGVSATFTTAQTNAGQSKGVQWTGSRVRKYGVAQIDAESLEATKDNKGAFLELIEAEVDGTIDEFGRQLSTDLYGDGSGSIARNNVGTASPITLLDFNDVKNFSVGMRFTANPTKTGAAGSMRAGTGTVTALNMQTGVITYSGTITSLAATDFLYPEGNYDGALTGLAGWIPLAAPGATLFFGVDRTADIERLSGWRLNQPQYAIEENLLELGTLISRARGKPNVCLMSPTKFMRLVQSLSSKVEYDGKDGSANYGFEYVTITLPSGKVKVYADPDCPDNLAYLLQEDTWCLRYLGKGVPHVVTDDGLDKIRLTSSDAVEIRVRYWGNLFCTAPGWNGVCALS